MAVSAQNTKIHVAIACLAMAVLFQPGGKAQGHPAGHFANGAGPPPDTEPVHAKAAGLYMICTISKHAAEAKGYADALMYDYRGYVAEATGANVFFVQGGSAAHSDSRLFPQRS